MLSASTSSSETGRCKTLDSKAAAKAVEILDSHVVPPLPDEVLRDIAGIMKRADAELAGE